MQQTCETTKARNERTKLCSVFSTTRYHQPAPTATRTSGTANNASISLFCRLCQQSYSPAHPFLGEPFVALLLIAQLVAGLLNFSNAFHFVHATCTLHIAARKADGCM